MQQRPIPAPPPLWQGEYDWIYRLMAAGLGAAAARRSAADATAPAEGTS